MSLSLRTVRRTTLLSTLLLSAALGSAQTDSPWLHGIHWAAEPASNDLEDMTGGKGVWVVDQCLLDSAATLGENEWETPWVTSPTLNQTQEYYKPGYFRSVTDRGHSIICRLGPQWSVNNYWPGDPYMPADYAADCKVAAGLMKNVHVWIIGNEANLVGEQTRWNPATTDYDIEYTEAELADAPEKYASIYVQCRDKIHEVTPDTTPNNQVVLMQPCSPGDYDMSPQVRRFMSSSEFLARMIAAVPDKSKIDGFALHAYAAPGGSNFGADSFLEDLKTQLMIIDQAGLGDRPVFLTEFNKHMPNATEANIGAKFLTTAYDLLNSWNTVGAGAVWPSQPNHPIRGTAWFVYRGGSWNDYSLVHWKSQIVSTSPQDNPWYAFQTSAGQNYAAGTGAGPSIAANNLWWRDTFDGTALDQSGPLPVWVPETDAGGQIEVSAGSLRLIGGTQNFGNASVRTPDNLPFTEGKLVLEVTFTNASPMADTEANFDLRVREGAGTGYSLTFFSSLSGSGAADKRGTIHLRKTGVWSTYQSVTVPGGINTGDRFRVEVTAESYDLSYRVTRVPSGEVVLDWTGANKFTNTDRRLGNIRLMTYNMREAQVDYVSMGGAQADLAVTGAEDWALFE